MSDRKSLPADNKATKWEEAKKRKMPAVEVQDHDGLMKIQEHFHGLIRERNNDQNGEQLLEGRGFQFPKLVEILETIKDEGGAAWIPVPGMYGGFNVNIDFEDGEWVLVCHSWIRVCGGSGQKHRITKTGVENTWNEVDDEDYCNGFNY